MVKPNIVGEVPISMFNLKVELEKIKERDGELNFRANKTEEYLNQFIEINKKDYKALRKKLDDLEIGRLKEEQIIKVLDLMPKTVEELKIILQGYVVTLTQDQMKKVVSAING